MSVNDLLLSSLQDDTVKNDSKPRGKSWEDQLFHYVMGGFASIVLMALGGILVALFYESLPAFAHFGPSFLTRAEWDPVSDQYSALMAIVGTVVTSVIALMIAIPLSFGIAFFLTELCPNWLKRPMGLSIEVLAGIPSIIYGMWGLFILVPLFAQYVQPTLSVLFGWIPIIGKLFSGPNMGISLLMAGVILALMIIPFIASVMRDVFETTPTILKESAYALGCTRWEVVKHIVLHHARNGIVGGIMLGLGRALGETMAVTFVIGNAHQLSLSLFAPGNSIASTLADEFAEASSSLHISSLFALGFILFVITFMVLSFSKLILMSMNKKEGLS